MNGAARCRSDSWTPVRSLDVAGDLLCPAGFEHRSECQQIDPLRDDSARSQGHRVSGYDCADRRDCIQADGSGYYVVSDQELSETPLTAFSQAHDFHLVYLNGANQSRSPQQSPGHYVRVVAITNRCSARFAVPTVLARVLPQRLLCIAKDACLLIAFNACSPGFTAQGLNPRLVMSSAPFGFNISLDWLATTARQSMR